MFGTSASLVLRGGEVTLLPSGVVKLDPCVHHVAIIVITIIITIIIIIIITIIIIIIIIFIIVIIIIIFFIIVIITIIITAAATFRGYTLSGWNSATAGLNFHTHSRTQQEARNCVEHERVVE